MIYRGTTPTIIYKVQTTLSFASMKEMQVTIEDSRRMLFTWSKSQVEYDDTSKEIAVTLTQMDSLHITAGEAKTQIRFLTENDKALVTVVKSLTVSDTLKMDVIGGNGDLSADINIGVPIVMSIVSDSESIPIDIAEVIQTGGGSDGIWYPTVSEEGIISWEKSSSETTPEARNIMGPAGATGPQGPAGQDGQDGADGADGEDGVGIASVSVNASNHLIVTKTDGTEQDAGEVNVEYPAYAKTEMESVYNTVRGYISTFDNPIIIGFNTDQHINPDSSTSYGIGILNEVTYGLKTLRDLTKKLPFNMVVLGGDTNGGGSTIAAMQNSAIYVSSVMDGTNCPLMAMTGNHEGGQDDESITRGQVLKSHMTNSMQSKVITLVDEISGYFDDPTCKVRFVFLDAFARSRIVVYTSTQYNAVLNTMLSGIPEGYKAIIFSHHPLDENLPQVADRKGWNNPAYCHDTLQLYKDKIIACFCGHVHNNLQVEDLDGITFVATTCAGQYELNDGSTRTNGTAAATAYDVFVIDQTAKKIYAVRYGNGNDREISFAHEQPVVPRGNILTNVTWQDGKRINSSGQLVDATGYSTTDIIDNVNAGDVLYFAEGTLPGNTNAWVAYSDDGQSTTHIPAVSSTDYGATYDSSKLYFQMFTSADGAINGANTFWYRVLANNKNPNDSMYGWGRFLFGETEFYASGYIKSVKLVYDSESEYFQNCAKMRFTFPTAKKGSLDIRVNEPFDET